MSLGNIFIICTAALVGLTVGNIIGGLLLGLVLMPIGAVFAYKYALEPTE